MDAQGLSKVTSFSIDDILTRRREEMKENGHLKEEGEEEDAAQLSSRSSPLSRPASRPASRRSTGSLSPRSHSPGSDRLSPQKDTRDSQGPRHVGFPQDGRENFPGHHHHPVNLAHHGAPPYFPYHPAMIHGPGGAPLFVQTSFGMIPTGPHQHPHPQHRALAGPAGLRGHLPSAAIGGGPGPLSAPIPTNQHHDRVSPGSNHPNPRQNPSPRSPSSVESRSPEMRGIPERGRIPHPDDTNHPEQYHGSHKNCHPDPYESKSAFAISRNESNHTNPEQTGLNGLQKSGENNMIYDTTNNFNVNNTNCVLGRLNSDEDDEDILVDVENVNSPQDSLLESDLEGEGEEEGCPSESGDDGSHSVCSNQPSLSTDSDHKKGKRCYTLKTGMLVEEGDSI